MTIVPALVLFSGEFLLQICGLGYPTSFYLTSVIADQRVFVENLDFARPYFPPGLERAPLPLVVPAAKDPGVVRVYVFGESAAMGFPGPSFSFSRILEVMLQDRYPEARFEFINTAMTAVNSHVILPIAHESAKHQPDLFIVYMGNNEVVGPYGAYGIFGPPSTNLELLRASLWIKRTRTGQALSRLMQLGAAKSTDDANWNGMSMFLGHHIRADDTRLDSVYSHFSRNLKEICEAGTNAGAKVIVCSVATNLKDSAPFDSMSSRDLSPEAIRQFQSLFQAGIEREVAQDLDAAIKLYQQAVQLDEQPADLHFRLAQCLLVNDQSADAKKHYVQARDRDTLRFRADSAINAEIRNVTHNQQAVGISFVDIDGALAEASDHHVPGSEFFYEHVHLNFAGNYLVARTVFRQVDEMLAKRMTSRNESAGPLSAAECKERLAFTDWNELTSLQTVEMLLTSAPFTNQLDNEKNRTTVQQQIQQIVRHFETDGFNTPMNAYRQALARSPEDLVLHMDFGLLLTNQRRYQEAAEQFSIVQRSLPYHPAPHVLLAQVLEARGKHDDALSHCEQALELRPGWPQAMELRKRILTMQQPAIQSDGF